MTEINEQEVKSPLDILSQLEKERTDACLMIGEIKAIMEMCSEHTAYKRAEDGMEWYLIFSNLRRLADMIEQSILRTEELVIDCEQKLKEV